MRYTNSIKEIKSLKNSYVECKSFEHYFDKLNHGLLVNKIGKDAKLNVVYKFKNGHFIIMYSFRTKNELFYRIKICKKGVFTYIGDYTDIIIANMTFETYVLQNKNK